MINTKIYTRNLASNEILLNNNVDKDVQMMVRPLNFLMVFYQKYKIRDNFITSNSNYDHILSLCATTILIILYIRQGLLDMNETLEIVLNTSYTDIFYIFDFSYIIFGFIFNFIQNVRSTDINVDLLLKIQEIHKINKNFKNVTNNIQFWNWCCFALYILYHFIQNLFNIIVYFRIYLIFFYDVNIIYAFCVIRLIRNELAIWIIQMQKAYEFCIEENIDEEDEDGEKYCERLYNGYFNILGAFNSYKEVSQGVVSFCLTI